MDNTKLIATHKRLSLLFTWMVFMVIVIFWASALWGKYFNEQKIQKSEFELVTQSILQKFSRWEELLPKVWERGKQRLQDVVRRLAENSSPEAFLSYFVLDEDNKIVLDNILEKPSFERLILDKDDVFYIDDETMVRVSSLDESILGEKIVFYKKQRYSREDFLYDLTGLLLLSLLLTVGLYLLWNKFVGKALKPVEQSLEDMSDFIHNAWHELKTPLAVMRGNLQVMQAEKQYDEKLLKKSLSQVDHVNNLIEWLKELSELWQISEKENLAIAPEITKVLREYDAVVQEKKLHINNTVKWMYVVVANRNELRVLLANIISNAIKYTPEKGEIDISMTKNILSVSDSWVWISKQDQEKIFDRFYQAEDARSKEGFGIWLSLVKKIIDMNEWKIEVESMEKKGTIFKVIF